MIVSRIAGALKRAAYILPDRPAAAQFEVTNKCNFNCVMCPRTKYYKVKIIDMEYDTYTSTLNSLLPLKSVILTGWGEPLLHPRIFDMASYAASHGVPSISMTTNGELLNQDNIPKILSHGFTDVRISVDNFNADDRGTGHPRGAEIMHKVEALVLSRKGAIPRIILAITLSPDNHSDIFKLIDEAARIRMNSVAIMRMNDRFDETLKRYTFEEERRVSLEYEAHGRKAGIRVGTPRMMSQGLRRALYRFGTRCPNTYDTVYVTAEGLITPCCALPHLVMGNPAEQSPEKIWNSQKFSKFRVNQRSVCAHCDLLDVTYKSRKQKSAGGGE